MHRFMSIFPSAKTETPPIETPIPNLSQLKLTRTGTSLLEAVYAKNNASEQLNDRNWMASELNKNDEYLVLPMTMNTLTCEVRCGSPSNDLPIPLTLEETFQIPMDFPVNGLVETWARFKYEAEEGEGLPLNGIISAFYFPQLGLLPESMSEELEMTPHQSIDFIPRPGEHEYTEDSEAEWAELGPDHWKKTKARGADEYEFTLDVQEFTSSPPNKIKDRTWDQIENIETRFDKGSILFADYFWSLDGAAQVLLDKESREKRYKINNDPYDEWCNPEHSNLSGRLQTLLVDLKFRHPPFGVHMRHLFGSYVQKRARDSDA